MLFFLLKRLYTGIIQKRGGNSNLFLLTLLYRSLYNDFTVSAPKFDVPDWCVMSLVSHQVGPGVKTPQAHWNTYMYRSTINVMRERLKWRLKLAKCVKGRYVKPCTCALPSIHKRFSLLIGPNDVAQYDIT